MGSANQKSRDPGVKNSSTAKLRVSGLANSDDRFRIFIDQVTDYAFLLLDLEGNVMGWGGNAEPLFGFSENEAKGLPYPAFFSSDDRQRKTPERELETARFEGKNRTIGWQLRKDGTFFWGEGILTALLDEDGKAFGFTKTVRDRTDLKKAEETQQRLREELASTNRDLEQFGNFASHDLKEPLRTISTYLSLLNRQYEGKLDANAERFIGFTVDAAKRMANLIDGVRNYAKDRVAESSWTVVDVAEVVKHAIDHLASGYLVFKPEIEVGELPKVQGDVHQLEQLFQNLLMNSIKYRSDEPLKIKIETKRTDKEWVFCVEDNGIGFDMKYADKVFDLFGRLHAASKYPGVGVGLALCKKIVERHSGRIWVKSDRGMGTRFFFSLPAASPVD